MNNRQWRSAAFWASDIDRAADDLLAAAEQYHPESRVRFVREVLKTAEAWAEKSATIDGETEGGEAER